MYRLCANDNALDLKLNFNPLMITYCLFLRALADKVQKLEEFKSQ